MNYLVVGREKIIRASDRTLFGDEDLKVFDAIDFGKPRFVEKMTDIVKEAMIREFQNQFPKYFRDELTIEVVDSVSAYA